MWAACPRETGGFGCTSGGCRKGLFAGGEARCAHLSDFQFHRLLQQSETQPMETNELPLNEWDYFLLLDGDTLAASQGCIRCLPCASPVFSPTLSPFLALPLKKKAPKQSRRTPTTKKNPQPPWLCGKWWWFSNGKKLSQVHSGF